MRSSLVYLISYFAAGDSLRSDTPTRPQNMTAGLRSHRALWAELQGVMRCACHVSARELQL